MKPHTPFGFLAIGTEVAEGRVANTNARWFAEKFGKTISIAVADDAGEVIPALRYLSRCRTVVICGGLGPTVDDLTRDFVCRWRRCGLRRHNPTWTLFRKKMRRLGIQHIPKNNELQALYPSAAKPLLNPTHGAVGFALQVKRTRYFFLPGVPAEFQAMVERYIQGNGPTPSTVFQFAGITESALDESLQSILPADLRETYGIYPKPQSAAVVVRSFSPDIHRRFRRAVLSNLSKQLLIEGDLPPESALLDILKKKRLRIAVAESCTAGLLASRLAAIPGSSKVFVGGAVVYDNALKASMLGVRKKILQNHGAVSAECAGEMARGAAERLGADIAVSITGIAGPSGGSIQKPVGTVYFGFFYATKQNIETVRMRFSGDRNAIRDKAAQFAVIHLLRAIRSAEVARHRETMR